MYKQPELKEDYRDEWLKADRDLAINSTIITVYPPAQESDSEGEIDKMPLPEDIQKISDQFTRGDFIKALKRVSQPIKKPKSSPKPSINHDL